MTSTISPGISPIATGLVSMLLLDTGLSQLKDFAPTIILVFAAIWCVIKLAPTWKEVKMRELDIREKEVSQREQQSISIHTLANVTERIAVEQKHTTEALRIAERVTMGKADRLAEVAQEVSSRLELLEMKVEKSAATA